MSAALPLNQPFSEAVLLDTTAPSLDEVDLANVAGGSTCPVIANN